MKHTLYIPLFFALIHANVMGQQKVYTSASNLPTIEYDTLLSVDKGNFPKKAKEALDGLQIGGFYRFIANYRKLSETYVHLDANRKNIFKQRACI